MTKVLVAEDETRIREVLVDILTDDGYEVAEEEFKVLAQCTGCAVMEGTH